MLVCNVSLRPPRMAIAAAIVEAATATDATATGNIVFATLVDDPASVIDYVDAYSGEIMIEAALAVDAADAGLIYIVALDEAVTAADLSSSPRSVPADVLESATASSVQDVSVTAAVAGTALVTTIFVTRSPASVSVLGSGTLLTVQ